MHRILSISTLLLLAVSSLFAADTTFTVTEAQKKPLIAAYQKAVFAQGEFQKAFGEYTKLAQQIIDQQKFPKGTTFDVKVGSCKPIAGKATLECSYEVSVVPPPPAPTEPDKK